MLEQVRVVGRGCVESVVRARQRRSQEGYILGIVLAAMVVGMTLITALLGLSFATHAGAISQQRLALERRAADGALEVAVEKLRTSADPLAECNDPSLFETVPMRLTSGGADADGDVAVECDPALDPAPSAGGLTVVGDDYGGTQTFGVPLESPGSSTVLHQGDGPLRFVGNVEVKKGAMLNGSTLGAEVSGSYKQGADGAGADSGCGVLGSVEPPEPARQLVDADDGEPSCGVSNLADLSIPAPPPVNRPADQAILPPPGDCTTPIGPGYFDPAAVQRLNSLARRVPQRGVPSRIWRHAKCVLVRRGKRRNGGLRAPGCFLRLRSGRVGYFTRYL